MKIDRLIGILAILLQQDKVTAPYLAEKFEVSRRTINRDIEAICQAGIPIVTTQGQNGGIAIMEGYRIDRTLLTSSDMKAILAGLRSLDSICKTNRYQQLMEKFSAGKSNMLMANGHIAIDLSSWYKSSLAPKIELIQAAIEEHRKISFCYFSPRGESRRELEPYLLVFQWSSWYVWGYCMDKQDYRMFKLNRLLDLNYTGELFEPRELPEFKIENDNIFKRSFEVIALFEPEFKWRLIEEYGPESFEEQADGKLLFRFWFMDKESSVGWLLSFGYHVELISPPELREEFAGIIKEMVKKYE